MTSSNVSLDILIDDLMFDLAVRIDGWEGLRAPIPTVLLVILGHAYSLCWYQARLSSGISSQV